MPMHGNFRSAKRPLEVLCDRFLGLVERQPGDANFAVRRPHRNSPFCIDLKNAVDRLIQQRADDVDLQRVGRFQPVRRRGRDGPFPALDLARSHDLDLGTGENGFQLRENRRLGQVDGHALNVDPAIGRAQRNRGHSARQRILRRSAD